jgi:hypothetical protein
MVPPCPRACFSARGTLAASRAAAGRRGRLQLPGEYPGIMSGASQKAYHLYFLENLRA